jgi:transcriptional regulator with XRE-family HTH domain
MDNRMGCLEEFLQVDSKIFLSHDLSEVLMDRKEFGKLVAALRGDRGWTQFQLGQYAKLDAPAVSQIERGVKKILDPGSLVRLADVFQLTTLERKAFFLAATGIEARQMVRAASAVPVSDGTQEQQVLNRMVRLVESLRAPAFLLDVWSDVLAINYTAFAFFQIPLEMMANAALIPGGMNVVRLIFGKDFAARTHFLNNWDYIATSTMRFFRESSLCYRATPYFQYLMRAFRDPEEYPLFDRYWRMISALEQDREGNFDHFSYDHDTFGHLSYAVATTTSVTPQGELLMNQYTPTDDATREVFDRLAAQSGVGVILGAPWPVKQMP